MTSDPPRDSLAAMLKIAPPDGAGGAFTAHLESFWGAAVPGDLLARATLAAIASGAAEPRSLHAALLAPASPGEVTLCCEALPGERTRVLASQGGAPVAEVLVRAGGDVGTLSYQAVALETGLPSPEDRPGARAPPEAEGWAEFAVGPIESRRIGAHARAHDGEPAVWLGWLRPREPLGDGAALHAAALAFLGEYRSHWGVELRLWERFDPSAIEVLDFALWIHRPARWEDWWLVRTRTDVGVGGRCLSRREIHARDGSLVASAAWEAAVRC